MNDNLLSVGIQISPVHSVSIQLSLRLPPLYLPTDRHHYLPGGIKKAIQPSVRITGKHVENIIGSLQKKYKPPNHDIQ
jgi:hypothetical protein